MRNSLSVIGVSIAATLSIAAGPNADYAGTDGDVTLACGGGPARVQGAENRVRITGACKSLTVEGADNEIYIDLAKGSTILITGADNKVFWTGPKGTIPRMRVNGVDNRIARVR